MSIIKKEEPPYIRAICLSWILDGLARRGIAADMLLRRHQMIPDEISNPLTRVDLRRTIAIFEEAAELSRDPLFGLHLATESVNVIPLGVIIESAPTLGAGLRAMERHAVAWHDGVAMEVIEAHDLSAFTYHVRAQTIRPRRQYIEAALAVICQTIRNKLGEDWSPFSIQLEHPVPTGLNMSARRVYQSIFRCPIEFSASSNAIILETKDLDRPGSRNYLSIAPFVEMQFQAMLRESSRRPTLADRVSNQLRSRLGNEEVTIASVARALKMSPRTLQRRLSEEGTSLRKLVQQYRQSVASAMLRESSHNITNVALTLGYTGPAALSRAFKGWTGATPRSFRKGVSHDDT